MFLCTLSRHRLPLPAQAEAPPPATSLHDACFRGDVATVLVCLEAGASVNALESSVSRTTPLHAACLSGQRAVVDLLLARRADPGARDWRGDTPLHM